MVLSLFHSTSCMLLEWISHCVTGVDADNYLAVTCSLHQGLTLVPGYSITCPKSSLVCPFLQTDLQLVYLIIVFITNSWKHVQHYSLVLICSSSFTMKSVKAPILIWPESKCFSFLFLSHWAVITFGPLVRKGAWGVTAYWNLPRSEL